MKSIRVGGTLCALALLASVASGETVRVRDRAGGENAKGGSSSAYFMKNTGSYTRGTWTGGSTRDMPMGVYDFEADFGGGWQQLLTFCVEPTAVLGFGPYPGNQTGLMHSIVSLTSSGFTAQEAHIAEVLWGNAFQLTMGNKTNAAAFQSILWELKQDGSLDLTGGKFKLNTSHSYSKQVRDIAKDWLNKITSGVWTKTVSLRVLSNPYSQDLLIAVPEPGAATAGLIGMASLAWFRRRC